MITWKERFNSFREDVHAFLWWVSGLSLMPLTGIFIFKLFKERNESLSESMLGFSLMLGVLVGYRVWIIADAFTEKFKPQN